MAMKIAVGNRTIPMLTSSAARAAGLSSIIEPSSASRRTRLRKFHPFLVVLFDRVAELLQQLNDRPLGDTHPEHGIEELTRDAARSIVFPIDAQRALGFSARVGMQGALEAREQTRVRFPCDVQRRGGVGRL